MVYIQQSYIYAYLFIKLQEIDGHILSAKSIQNTVSTLIIRLQIQNCIIILIIVSS